jgi:hypothetical protein
MDEPKRAYGGELENAHVFGVDDSLMKSSEAAKQIR